MNRGLRRLFKHAARWRHVRGQGYWIGLQHWFVLGLSRDEEDENTGWTQRPIMQQTIGPPYHRVFTRAARAHFARVMSALEIDMIFIEDRVGFRRFRRVLGVLYEIYDIHGGRQRIEEMHFSGLRGCRVIVCEVTPDEPFRSDAYPEPDYDDIGRARVLHVFRDREDDAVDTPSPRSSTGRPVPVPAGV